MEISISAWNGFAKKTFAVGGRESFIVCPADAAPGHPWVWRAEFFGAFDAADRALLERGWHLAYHCVSDMYGCPQAVESMHAFCQVIGKDFGLSPWPVLFGFSRGGLYACNYATAHPEGVAALYLDAPVLDIRSWPGPMGASTTRDDALWQECLRWYGLDAQSAPSFAGNPLDRTEALAQAGIPVLLVVGLADEAVPYAENGAPFARRFREAGGEILVLEKEGCGHHPHSLENPAPIVEWIQAHQAGRHGPLPS